MKSLNFFIAALMLATGQVIAAKNQLFGDLPPGDYAAAAMVDRGSLAGNRIGISGTPALFKGNGEKIEGYRPYQELIPQILQ